jgi:hypothetical protein
MYRKILLFVVFLAVGLKVDAAEGISPVLLVETPQVAGLGSRRFVRVVMRRISSDAAL